MRKRYRSHDNERGVALLVTITVLFVVFAIVSEVNRNVRDSISKAHLSMERSRLTDMAASGIHLGIALLMADKRTTEVDTSQEIWADSVKIDELLADLPMENGTVSLKITDELGKIQINSLVKFPEGKDFNTEQKMLWESVLKMLNPEDDSVDSLGQNDDIIKNIKDWIDSGDDDASEGMNDAETDYYEGLTPPYKAANGPLRSLDEMVLIKGITPEMMAREEMGYRFIDQITVYGMEKAKTKSETLEKKTVFTYPGKININTADLPVIMALMPGEKSDLENSIAAQAIYDYREERNEDSEESEESEGFVNELKGTWYLNCPGCEDSGLSKKSALITTKSDIFSIVCRAQTKELAFSIRAVIQREDKNGKYTVLSWKED